MLEEFLDTSAHLFADDYLVLKIDVEKMEHGGETEKRLRGDRSGGIPWITILDGDGAEETIATNGALEFFARCRVNDGGQDRIQIFVTSSVDGWFEEDTGGAQTAGTEILMFQSNIATGNPSYQEDIDEGSAVAPDGSYVAIDGEMLGLGLNIFGHSCIAVGNAMLFTGTL